TSPNINGKICALAIDCFTRAIALDPGYAQAYAGLGMAHVLDFHNRWTDSPDASLRLADELAAKAILADPNEPFAYAVASVAAMNLRDYRRAKTAVDKALQLSSNYALALNARGGLAIYS